MKGQCGGELRAGAASMKSSAGAAAGLASGGVVEAAGASECGTVSSRPTALILPCAFIQLSGAVPRTLMGAVEHEESRSIAASSD